MVVSRFGRYWWRRARATDSAAMTISLSPDFTGFCGAFTAGLRAGKNTLKSSVLPAQVSLAAVGLAIDATEAACIDHPTGTVRVARSHLACLLVRAWLFGDLVDTMACLQFNDLSPMGVRATWWQRWLPLSSNRQAKELAKRREGLRNDFAHSQDVIERHWDTVVALSANIGSLGGR